MSHTHIVVDTDVHYKIDGVTRTITNINETKRELVQNDHNSERFTFEVPRFVDGHDFSECTTVQVHYANCDTLGKVKHKDVYTVDDLRVNEEDPNTVLLSWLISANATRYVGTLNFSIRFACETGAIVDYAWNTTTFKGIKILEAMYNSGEVVEAETDAIAALRRDIQVDYEENDPKKSNYLRNRPFYELPAPTDIAWDGDVESFWHAGKAYPIYKDGPNDAGIDGFEVYVSNQTPEPSAFIGGTVVDIVCTDYTTSEVSKTITADDVTDWRETASKSAHILTTEWSIGTVPYSHTIKVRYEDEGEKKAGIYFDYGLSPANILPHYTKSFTYEGAEPVIKRIDPKFLPEGGVGYDETYTGTMEFQYDGDPTGKTTVATPMGTLVKTSDWTAEPSELIGATGTLGEQSMVITEEMIVDARVEGLPFVVVAESMFIIYEPCNLEGTVFPEAGTYIADMGVSASLAFTGTVTRTHTIDRKYLPGGLASGSGNGSVCVSNVHVLDIGSGEVDVTTLDLSAYAEGDVLLIVQNMEQ